ncbi:hypothetical protein GcM3_097024 [Golovinomyces cichoracearum]|uniref:DNA recombination and repair protein Rad51-like C-terminal domain-containing protein n=1 Tax=Golovinomyces cichoracearum TaxID=62708 RepID=A0A420IDG3_9PEZI|nr:hypothetical protein GcM3_097024 [Golovinomyces cichoracearum]
METIKQHDTSFRADFNCPKFYNEVNPKQGDHLLSSEIAATKGAAIVNRGHKRGVSCACVEVDELLGGGIEKKYVAGISCEGNEGKIFTLNLLSSILIAHVKASPSQAPLTKAIIIDSTGLFPLNLFASILKSRLIAEDISSASDIYGADHDRYITTCNQMRRCLEMVKISRIFDIDGLWEILGETEHSKGIPNKIKDFSLALSPNNNQIGGERDQRQVFCDEEASNTVSETISTKNAQPILSSKTELKIVDDGIEILIVDNMTTLISEFLTSREKTNAHEHLALLSKKMHDLTWKQNMLTLLHNTTASSRTPLNASENNYSPAVKSVSMFSSNPLKPALGQVFAQFTSLHLLFSPLPRTSQDIKLLYQPKIHLNTADEIETVNYVTVIEILKDEGLSTIRQDLHSHFQKKLAKAIYR